MAKTQKVRPGLTLEKVVARIQQMMDPNSTVSHNEKLVDRTGNKRQYDVVVRGSFGGRPILGVIECKDHNRRKGPDAIDAFAKKVENLGANFGLIVSRKGFTQQALELAKHENIGCLSLLPDDPKQAGFSIGDMWYGIISKWQELKLTIVWTAPTAPIDSFDGKTVKWDGKLVWRWFARELLRNRGDETREGEHTFCLAFDEPRQIEIEGNFYGVKEIICIATRIFRKKKKWVSWSGDALLDWHSQKFTIPPNGVITGSAVPTDLSTWADFDGEIPYRAPGLATAIIQDVQQWDESMDADVPDLSIL
jgi:hypothetical protein